MLQNRVDPAGNIITTRARGAWLGNRGQLHGAGKTILRAFKNKAWITCLLQFKGKRRQIMAPNLWTELFFFDEATAFAAGHRPCFECRREDADRFKSAWLSGNPKYHFNRKTSITEIDKIIHAERISKNGNKVTYESTMASLPDGTFVLIDKRPYLVFNNKILQWTPFGYEKAIDAPAMKKIEVLTPRSIVNAFLAGYKPQTSII